ncbi:hypothetical protein [uncultured Ilyobacter sp.]|uniref:major capsid protein n=1 Tax=uncultured Ilyobacter sp. TaxID=544433 RepID=UPI0029BFF098|nr:hypothetical protein [uncultured Ilyobacter sp.]
MNEKMIYLIALINEAQQRIQGPKIYTNKFLASGNKFLSNTETIRIDELLDHFVVAGIVGRSDVLPLLEKDGFQKTEFEPDIVGGTYPYSASDVLNLRAGVPTYTTDGKEINSVAALEVKYSKMAAAAIYNRVERQCADAYLKGTYTDKNGTVHNVGVTSSTTLSLTDKVVSDEILKKVTTFIKKYGVSPKIEAGINVFNAIKNEARNSENNINGVSFAYNGDSATLTVAGKQIELLIDAIGTDGNTIDTSSMLILSDKETLGVGYGCLTWGDVTSNETKIARAELIAGELSVETTTGQKGLWAKSAPMPVVLNHDKFIKYNCTGL